MISCSPLMREKALREDFFLGARVAKDTPNLVRMSLQDSGKKGKPMCFTFINLAKVPILVFCNNQNA